MTAMRMRLIVLLVPLLVSAKSPDTTVLNEWPMLMVHDAATTYLKGGLLHQVNNWAKTQPDGGAKGELNCGARAFDWRPALQSDGTMKMHHGSVVVDHPMSDALDEMVSWCGANGTDPMDLVVLGITDCTGTGCAEAAQKLLDARNISYVTDCSQLKGLTAAAAFKRGALPGGGSILATFDCWEGNYDSAVACSGFGTTFDAPARELDGPEIQAAVSAAQDMSLNASAALSYSCYTDSSTKDFPVNRMKAYINKTIAAGPPSDGQLYTVQCLWQESAAAVTVGELHGSTLLDDESRSELNNMVNDMIKQKVYDPSRLNMVEVNNVCDGGLELLATLRQL
eukprot:TRINITY_DN6435_c0_g1_i1.p1 TRINITY_DN6435_c0_g1~~TRINITY_DN6435_c0_g1_i1.p1  ORF type:complete len:339 (+),score=82.65 TRINITY_DN6435_c0_g1_i1:142-1158(+)